MGKICISAFGVVLFVVTSKISLNADKFKNNYRFPKISFDVLIVIMY